MNQILITEEMKNNGNKANKGNVSKDIRNIVKFFAIFILIFGMCLSGNGIYASIKDVESKKNEKKQLVEIFKNGNKCKLKVSSEAGINIVTYTWNNSSTKVLKGGGKKVLEEEIPIPEGMNNLNITVIDSNQKRKKYTKVLKHEILDVTEPEIIIEPVRTDLKVTIKDDNELDYLLYEYGDETKRINQKDDEKQEIITMIQVLPGENVLKIEAVDKAGNIAKTEKKIIGKNRPVIKVTQDKADPNYIIIKVKDDDGLRMVSFFVNKQEYQTDPNVSLDSKTFEWKQKLDEGENNIVVHAYNVKEKMTEYKINFNTKEDNEEDKEADKENKEKNNKEKNNVENSNKENKEKTNVENSNKENK